ncbi:hypothetical protein H0H87_011231 [Tephrocybe sp. NHM501043]|nr:hypothetical protein H0H87_011231 [Tephrocybe sp. NHM501043]
MLSGDPTLRTYDPNSFAQQAITFLCLDFNGVSTRHNSLPAKSCPSGIRAQVNFPSCWDGKNVDSPDHKSHVAFLSEGADKGTCKDPKYPVTLPRIFIEVYWSTAEFDQIRSSAKNATQPFVYAYGDPTGYGYHADFLNGWDKGVLQNAVDKCHCNIYGDPQCCADQKIFTLTKGKQCRITKTIDEQTTGTMAKLPGNNPVQKEGVRATMFSDTSIPTLLSPVYAYTGDTPTQVGKPIVAPGSGGPSSLLSSSSSTDIAPSSTKSTSSTVLAPQPSSSYIASSPMPSSSVLSSSSMVGSSKPVASTTASSASAPSASVPPFPGPPASGAHGSSSTSTRPAGQTPTAPAISTPTSSGENINDECGDEEDDNSHEEGNGKDETGDGHNSALPAPSSTQPLFTSASPAHTSSSQAHMASTPASTGPASSDDENDEDLPYCDEEDDGGEVVAPAPSPSPAPPSSGSGSNRPEPNSVHSHAASTPAVPTPVTTLVVAGSPPTGNFLPVASSHPICSTGKFRHKQLKEARALREKRAFHHARSIHDRSMRSHRHARAF